MDVSVLHAATEDLAEFLSEVTQADLGEPVHAVGDLGDLYLRIIDQNVSVAVGVTGTVVAGGRWPDPSDRRALGGHLDPLHGGGLEAGYRQTARLMENAFASRVEAAAPVRVKGLAGELSIGDLHELQVGAAIVHAWDVASVLGLPYQPVPGVARRILGSVLGGVDQARSDDRASYLAGGPTGIDDVDALECLISLLGKRWPSGTGAVAQVGSKSVARA